ncbi:MAG: hypothetical protein COA70_09305 [Planctomycetota bacterium]|nr:MAG: hypothetical protein COA70_09305 [Planctomycetota bacterium]
MTVLSLLLLVIFQSPISSGEIYQNGSTRRPYGRISEPSHAQLLAALGDRSSDGEVRMLALELLAYRSEPVPYETLRTVKSLARGDSQVDYVRCLGLAGAKGLKDLSAMRRNRRPEVRAEVTYALVLMGENGETLGRHYLRDRKEKPMIRIAALRALADRESPFGAVEALRRLHMEEGPMLYECLDILRRDPSPDYVSGLIDLLAVAEGRAANEVVDLLQRITGYRIANDYKTWKHFYLKHKADGTEFRREPDPNAEAATLSYMGIPIFSDRVVFVLDSSSSMNSVLPEQRTLTRATKSVAEFVKMLPRLPSTARFNVFFFDSEVHGFQDKMVSVTQPVLAAATDFVESNTFAGGTNLFGGLDRAFGEDEVEEVLLLTDGAPSVGEITDPLRILARVSRWNRWRGNRISTISLGAPPSARAFLYRLAMENRGACRIIQ